jgi:hypothetical protein
MGRRLLTGLALATAFLCVSAGPAAAGGTISVLPDRVQPGLRHVAGPAFAGESIAYAVPNGRDGFTLNVRRPDGTVTSQHLDARGGGPIGDWEFEDDALAASPERIALAESLVTCHDESGCKYKFYDSIESNVIAGPLGGPFAFRGCSNLENPAVDASGAAIAYFDDCAGGAVVRDPTAPPETASRVFPSYGYEDVRIAGPYLAVDTRDEPGTVVITVYDWRSGDEVFHVSGAFGLTSFDVQDDGTLVFTSQDVSDGYNSSEVFWASRAHPTPHHVTRKAALMGPIRVTDGKVAVLAAKGVKVFALDGTKLAETPGGAPFAGFDFDGRRLAYVDQPCEVAAIVVWDLSGSAPGMPPGDCPAARGGGSKGVVDLSHRNLGLPLRCPARPPLGCGGYWAAQFNTKPAAQAFGKWVDLKPGEERTIRFRFSQKTACRLVGVRSRRATIDLGAPYYAQRHGEAGSARFKLRSVGRARGC